MRDEGFLALRSCWFIVAKQTMLVSGCDLGLTRGGTSLGGFRWRHCRGLGRVEEPRAVLLKQPGSVLLEALRVIVGSADPGVVVVPVHVQETRRAD